MRTFKESLRKRILVASHELPADKVIKNGKIIDVFTQEIIFGDVAIADGQIVGIGDYEGNEVIDATNKYICPSFIDAHVHIESSMVTPSEFAKVVLPHGVTTVITDPHEIANVAGASGIEYMLQDAKNIPLDIFIMLPSSVPATPFEHNGATLHAKDLEPFYKDNQVLGLAEVMDYPSLKLAEDTMMDKILVTKKYRNQMDGHLAGLDQTAVNVYRTAGIQTDHEATTSSEALDRLRRGMYLLIREGSVAKNLKSLIKVVNEKNARHCLFCTDDKDINDLITEGSIDHNVRLAIKEGIDPLLAIQMATINIAECYGLTDIGAIAPGYDADFLLLEDLESIQIEEVYKAGEIVARTGKYTGPSIIKVEPSAELTNTVHFLDINEKDLQLKIDEKTNRANIIGIIPNNLITKKLVETVHVENGLFIPSIQNDQLKLIAIERHHCTGNIGLGIVKGFGLKDGAIATTIAHDSHNIVATGTNDADILKAIHTIKELGGGLVIIRNGEVIASLSLTIAGLISDKPYQKVRKEIHQLHGELEKVGYLGNFNPFLTLSFLTLPVIPDIKLTDIGLFDVNSFQHIDINAN